MKDVAIRVDASARIGTGHVRRMLSLAGGLRAAGAKVRFVTRALGLDSAGLIQSRGFDALTLPPPGPGAFAPDRAIAHSDWAEVPLERDVEETVCALSQGCPDWVVVDSYAVDARWHRAMAERLSARIAVIDDLADRALEADLVVDHNVHPDHAAKFAGRLNEGARLLAGPSYAMIDPVYAEAARYAFNHEVRSVGVFVGGVDAGCHTSVVLAALDEAGWEGPVEVVSTSANPNLAALRESVIARPNTALSLDLANLAAFFARHDLQIGAGGGASWERCCIGPPTIALVCARNQRLSVPFLDAAGMVIGFDALADASTQPRTQPRTLAETIAEAIANPRARGALCAEAMTLVDGRGTARIAEAMLEANSGLASPSRIGVHA